MKNTSEMGSEHKSPPVDLRYLYNIYTKEL